MRSGVIGAVMALAAAPAFAEPDILSVVYSCERGVTIPVTYVNGADGSVAVLQVEGRQIALPLAKSASGARFAREQVSGYDWWNKGQGATLAWFDADKGEEVFLYMECKETADAAAP